MAIPTQMMKVAELPITSVTVYNDRAELLRNLKVHLNAGLNEVVIANVSPHIDSDSIRVDGKGSAIIQEVEFKNEFATPDEADNEKVKKLTSELEAVERSLPEAKALQGVYEKQLTSLDTLISNFDKSIVTPGPEQAASSVEQIASRIDGLYTVHREKSVQLSSQLPAVKEKITKLKEQTEKFKAQIGSLRSKALSKGLLSIVITLEAKQDCDVFIELIYQVRRSCWTPSYDVRVETHGAGRCGGDTKMRIYYYGEVQQLSGEEWNEVELVLSTAQPRSNGELPELGTLQARFRRPVSAHGRYMSMAQSGISGVRMPAPATGGYRAPDDYEEDEDADMDTFAVEQYVPERQLLSTNFNVPHRKSIPSDNSQHRVTIAVIELEPLLHCDCVPSKDTNVFLTASAVNTSTYPLLSGQASIYLNGAFNSKARMKAVGCGEKFDIAVGVDSTLKVTYKPAHEFKQQTGFISKWSMSMHEQRIIVKNTKQDESVLLTIQEHIPKSTDEKIKMNLHAPEVHSAHNATHIHHNLPLPVASASVMKDTSGVLGLPEVGAVLNESNNLEWTLLLAAKEERELLVKWSVEYPPTEHIEYKEEI